MTRIYSLCVNQDNGTYLAFCVSDDAESLIRAFSGISESDAVGLLTAALKKPVRIDAVISIDTQEPR